MQSLFSNLNPKVSLVLRVIFLVLAYVVSGHLALLLAIPPGFATALFPPLGIGIASCLIWGTPMVWGVFFGSLLLNISLAMGDGASLSMPVIMVAGEIAIGSTLAAYVATWIIKKLNLYPNALTDEWTIFIFFIIAGPLSCIISATVGSTTLLLNGLIPLASFLYSWLTWWTGDAIGVLISIPFVFILFGKPRDLWRQRATSVGIPMFFSLTLIVYLFFYTSESESTKSKKIFDSQANDIAHSLIQMFDENTTAVMPVKGLFLASETVTEKDFRVFANEVFKVGRGVKTLAWDAYVRADELESFKQAHDSDYGDPFRPYSFDINENITKLEEKASYVFVTFIEPYASNQLARGFEITSSAERRETLHRALHTGLPAMTGPVHRVQAQQRELTYIVFLPVFKSVDTPKMASMREQLILGYAAAIIPVSVVREYVENRAHAKNFYIEFNDVTNPAAPISVFNLGIRSPSKYAQLFQYKLEQDVNGRKLQILISPADGLFAEFESEKPWFVLVGGLLFVSLLGGFLLLVTGRTKLISSLVDERSKELDYILSSAVEGILIFNSEGFIEKVNPAACLMINQSEHELLQSRIVHYVPAIQHLLEHQDYLLFDKTYQKSWQQKETTVFCGDNQSIEFEVGISGISLPDKRLFVMMLHDIRKRKKVDRLKNEFISTVSHELRTPLTSITGVLGILVGGHFNGIPDKVMDMLVIAKNNSERLGRLINDILDIEKLELGQLKMSYQEADLNELLNQSFEHNLGYAIKYGVHLALDNSKISTDAVFVRVDTDRFLQVMSNLISNAVKFSHLDGIVTVGAEIEEQSVKVWVEDHGDGIPEEFQGRIFQKFAQADSSDTRKREGTGLGLSISQMIVERMGGQIHFTTEISEGTTFYFRLPIYKP